MAFGDWWGRRSRKAKIWLIVGAAVLVLIVIGALSSPGEESDDATPGTTTVVVTEQATTTEDAEETTTEEATTEETTTETAPQPSGPRPIVLEGSGARVREIRLPFDSPLVLQARHRGSANFIVELVRRGGGGEFLLVNEIGNYSGKVAAADATAGRYRVRITADGSWVLRFQQPVPGGRAKPIPGTIRGRGANVLRIRATEDLQPIVSARHRGQANFIVEAIGYGDVEGSILLFNEIGNFQGETLAEEMPAGDYLLAVQADGPWTIRFTP